ncbi:MAG: replicative DNA helicase [Prevotella sp.]|nr:replicative DNA helicase [Prevotella sp.]
MAEAINTSYLEMSVLGCIMRYPETFYDIRQTIGDDINCFSNETCREIYKVLLKIDNDGSGLDYNNIIFHLQNSNIAYDNFDVIWARGNKEAGLRDVKRLIEIYRRVELKNLSSTIAEKATDTNTSFEDLISQYQTFIEKKTLIKSGVTVLKDSVVDLQNKILSNQKGEKLEGTLTGFEMLDKTNGFHKGEFIVIGGASSHGKTSLALTITLNAIQEENKIAYYSLEMDHISLTARLTAMVSRVPASDMLYKRLTDEQMNAVSNAVHNKLKLMNLFYDDNSTSTFENIVSSIRMMKKRYDIIGAVVDYLQILNVNTKSKDTKEQIMAGVARRLKNLSIELGIWIIGLSQLNRDKENPQPRIDRLRDSGQIAEAADIVIFVYRPELYDRGYDFENKVISPINTALIDIAKGRNIGIGSFIVDFEPTLTHFTPHVWTDEESAAKDKWKTEHNKKSSSKYLDKLLNKNTTTSANASPTFTPYTPLPKEPDLPFEPPNENEEPKF